MEQGKGGAKSLGHGKGGTKPLVPNCSWGSVSDRRSRMVWFSVLTLAMLASGDLWAQAKEEEEPPYLREKRATHQEKYYLEA